MCRSLRGFPLFAAILEGTLALLLGTPVAAAAPRYIIASGALLPQPIVLDDWQENLALMGATVEDPPPPTVSDADLAARPSVDLALFWDATIWEPLVLQHGLSSLQPQDANQHARFYPAIGANAPLFVGMADGVFGPHRIGVRGLAVLARHGVPTRVEPVSTPGGAILPLTGRGTSSHGWPATRLLVAVMIGMLLIVGGLSCLRHRWRPTFHHTVRV
ncbi:MAG: hypothetical protein ACR2M3_13330 [Thermomicrobiales bacterium]